VRARPLLAGLLAVALAGAVAVACQPAAPGPLGSPPAGASPGPSIDRQLADSDELRQVRSQYVDRFIAPVVTDGRIVAAFRHVPATPSFGPARLPGVRGPPAPIGFGQTISQPSLVAQMTEMLDLDPGDSVLEVAPARVSRPRSCDA
jgi:protein-L-isoaspartate(D-aspartate) O-methyltransferase